MQSTGTPKVTPTPDFNPAELVGKFRTHVGDVHRMAAALDHDPKPALQAECLNYLKAIADVLKPLTAVQLVQVMKEWYWHPDLHSTDGVIFAALLLTNEEYALNQKELALKSKLAYAKDQERGLQKKLEIIQHEIKQLEKEM